MCSTSTARTWPVHSVRFMRVASALATFLVLPATGGQAGDLPLANAGARRLVIGRLALFNEEADKRAYQIFPTPNMIAAQPGGLGRIAAGEPLGLPPSLLKDEGFRFRITPPAGQNRLVGVVIPAGTKRVDDILSQHADGADFYNLDDVPGELAHAMRGSEVVQLPPENRAVATWNYQIVD